jgi:hypothetical protein
MISPRVSKLLTAFVVFLMGQNSMNKNLIPSVNDVCDEAVFVATNVKNGELSVFSRGQIGMGVKGSDFV